MNAKSSDTTKPPFVRPGDPINDFLRSFWQRQVDEAEQETPDYRHPPLPLARIKKVMKNDPDVKMIAADAPILFCKACEIFIAEITARAFIVADSNKRRTLSRSDISKALSKSDQFDFLIDIVPREEPMGTNLATPAATAASGKGKKRSEQPDSRDESNPDSYGEDDHPDGPVNPSSVLSELQTLLSNGRAIAGSGALDHSNVS